MAWLILERVTTVVPGVNKDVSAALLFSTFSKLEESLILWFSFFCYNECFHVVPMVVDLSSDENVIGM